MQVEIIPTPPGQSARTKLQAMVAAGDPPDSIFTESWNIPEYAERNIVAALDPFVTRDKFDLKVFFDATVALCRWRVSGAEHLYALPRHPSPLVLFYNLDLFTRRAVKPPDASWMWDTLLEVARRLVGPDEWGVLPPYVIPHHLFPVVRSMGGDVLDKDLKRFVLDQAPGAAAVQWVADLATRHGVAPPFKELSGPGDRRPFGQGKVALAPDIYPFIGTVAAQSGGAFTFDVAPLPKGVRGRVNRNVAGTYALVVGGRNSDVGWEWLKFLSTKEVHLLLAATGVVMPALREAAQSPEFLTPPPPAPQVNRKVFVDALEQDIQIAEPAIPVYSEITTLLSQALVPVWNGEIDARTVLQSVAPQVNALLGSY
jgi:multiple sugar transport system substrate-binding protein